MVRALTFWVPKEKYLLKLAMFFEFLYGMVRNLGAYDLLEEHCCELFKLNGVSLV